MNIAIRNKIRKNRIIYNLGHRVIDINNRVFYFVFNLDGKNRKRIVNLKNSHVGESCYIVGNGPSLKVEDLELIKDNDCFAANLIYRIFDHTQWRPKYYFLFDRYADTKNDLEELEIPYMFIGDYYWRKRKVYNPNAVCVHTSWSKSNENIEFSEKIEKGIVSHWTVSYSMIQAAVYMGYKTIYLLGMDHNYALTFDENGNVMEDTSIKSHFFEDKDSRDVIANIEAMNKAYISAEKYARTHGINIYNVTRGGKLEWFPRKRLEDSLDETKRGQE